MRTPRTEETGNRQVDEQRQTRTEQHRGEMEDMIENKMMERDWMLPQTRKPAKAENPHHVQSLKGLTLLATVTDSIKAQIKSKNNWGDANGL
jgi:hypothetical protein